MNKIGFIGCGNMGFSLAVAASKSVSPEFIYLSNRSEEKLKKAVDSLSCHLSNNEEIAEICDFIYLGVKPQVLPDVLEQINPIIRKRNSKPVIISMAAGIKTESIKKSLGNIPVIRIMPNTPVSIGKGVILYDVSEVLKEDEDFFIKISEKAGVLIKLPEKDIDAGSVVSGCGPAFVFMFLDALAKGGEKVGLDRDTALKLSANTVLGAASLYIESGKNPDELIKAVCSPGGSTIEGVKKFNELDLYGTSEKALKASFDRTKELGK